MAVPQVKRAADHIEVMAEIENMKPEKIKCQCCGEEVTQEDYDKDADMCIACLEQQEEQEKEREHMVQVTREMAIDAGDRKLEGQWIHW